MNGTLIWETESEAQSVRGRKLRERVIFRRSEIPFGCNRNHVAGMERINT
jgi:hypothetical protein